VLGYSLLAMDKITLLISLLFVIASLLAFFLWQRINKVEETLHSLKQSKEEKQAELENTRKTAKRRGEELESVRDDLQSTKSKLKKLQKKEQNKKVGDKNNQADQENSSHVGAVVRVSNEEVESRHQKQLNELKAQIAELEGELEEHKAREEKTKAETAKAAKALKLNAETNQDELDPDALKTQIEALKRAAGERETELKRKLRRAKADARTHERRATTNHQLYQVAKGQLSLLEDRLARIKLKYEGATDPSKLIKEKPAETTETTSAEAPVETSGDQPETVDAEEAKEAPVPANDDESTPEATDAPAVEAGDSSEVVGTESADAEPKTNPEEEASAEA
jgi:DNA repair exonuclease SbcCD ATPase subunit